MHLWEDAQRSQQLRSRLWELRVSSPDRSLCGNPSEILSDLSKAREDFEFLAGHYLVFKKNLLQEYKHIMASTHHVWDAPTLPVLRLAISGLESQIDWAHSGIEEGSYVVDGVLMGYKCLISNEEQIFKRCARF